MASRPLSKKNITPKNRKNRPNPVTPIPISVKRKKRGIEFQNGSFSDEN